MKIIDVPAGPALIIVLDLSSWIGSRAAVVILRLAERIDASGGAMLQGPYGTQIPLLMTVSAQPWLTAGSRLGRTLLVLA